MGEVEGEFSKTETQIKAKIIRTSCTNMIKEEFLPAFNHFKSEINEIREIYKGFVSEEGKRKRNYEIFDKLEEIGVSAEQLFSTGVKRIKID